MRLQTKKRAVYAISAMLLPLSLVAVSWPALFPIPPIERLDHESSSVDLNDRTYADIPSSDELARISSKRLQRPLVEPTPVTTTEQQPIRPRSPSRPDADLIAVFGSGDKARGIVQLPNGQRQTVRVGDRIGSWTIAGIDINRIQIRHGDFSDTIELSDAH